jgi:hypothetical protein
MRPMHIALQLCYCGLLAHRLPLDQRRQGGGESTRSDGSKDGRRREWEVGRGEENPGGDAATMLVEARQRPPARNPSMGTRKVFFFL